MITKAKYYSVLRAAEKQSHKITTQFALIWVDKCYAYSLKLKPPWVIQDSAVHNISQHLIQYLFMRHRLEFIPSRHLAQKK